MFPQFKLREKKRFHRHELMTRKREIEQTESFIFQLYQFDSLIDLLLIILDSDLSSRLYYSFLTVHADSYLSCFSFVIESKFIECDEPVIDFSSFVRLTRILFEKYIDLNSITGSSQLLTLTTHIAVPMEQYFVLRDALSEASHIDIACRSTTKEMQSRLFEAVQTIRIHVIASLAFNTIQNFMLTKYYFNWRSQMCSELVALSLAQLLNFVEDSEGRERSKSSSHSHSGSELEDDVLGVMQSNPGVFSLVTPCHYAHAATINPTKNLPKLWSIKSTIPTLCRNMSLDVLNEIVSNDMKWVLVLLCHMENSTIGFSLHNSSRSWGTKKRKKPNAYDATSDIPFAYCNKIFEQLYGFQRPDVQGKSLDFAVVPAENPSSKHRFSNHRQNRVAPSATVTTHSHFDDVDQTSCVVDGSQSPTAASAASDTTCDNTSMFDVAPTMDSCGTCSTVGGGSSRSSGSGSSSSSTHACATKEDVTSFTTRLLYLPPEQISFLVYKIVKPLPTGSLKRAIPEKFYSVIVIGVKGIFARDTNKLLYHIVLHSELLPGECIKKKCNMLEMILMLLPEQVIFDSNIDSILPNCSDKLSKIRALIAKNEFAE